MGNDETEIDFGVKLKPCVLHFGFTLPSKREAAVYTARANTAALSQPNFLNEQTYRRPHVMFVYKLRKKGNSMLISGTGASFKHR